MGNEPQGDPIMTHISWWFTDTLSRMLEPDERDAVLGDFAESGETGSQALNGVLGLVVRRQTVLWAGWRPWVILACVTVPLGLLLSVVSRTTADGSAVYLWMYANNWDWALTRNPGFWRVLADSAVLVSLWYITLACGAWTGGFVLGFASRGMVQINAVLLFMMLLFGEFVAAPRYLAYCEEYMHRTFGVPDLPDVHSGVSELAFYRVMFPLIVQAVLVAVPALWGLRHGMGAVKLCSLTRIALCTAAVTTIAAMVIQERGFWLFLNPQILHALGRPEIWIRWGLRLLPFVAYWPAVYLVATAVQRRWQGSAPHATISQNRISPS